MKKILNVTVTFIQTIDRMVVLWIPILRGPWAVRMNLNATSIMMTFIASVYNYMGMNRSGLLVSVVVVGSTTSLARYVGIYW